MNKLDLYNRLRGVPPEAVKPIQAGRLKGKSDINPMWRIKALTEAFGPCGEGWKYDVEKLWLEPGANGEVAAFVLIGLYIRKGADWGEKIPGVGGSMLVANERNGAYTSDECYKMALTDALSVACKALGMAADVYWDKDPTKYNRPAPAPAAAPVAAPAPAPCCERCGKAIGAIKTKDGVLTPQQVADRIREKYGSVICKACQNELTEAIA